MAAPNTPFSLGRTPTNFSPKQATLGGYIDAIDDALAGAGGGGGGGVTIDDLPAGGGIDPANDLIERWDDSAQESVKDTVQDFINLVGTPTAAGLYAGYEVPTGSTGTALLAAIAAAQTNGTGVYLPKSLGTISLADIGNSNTIGAVGQPVHIVGDGPDRSIIDGADGTPSRGTRRFFIRGPVRIEGVRFQNDNEIWSTFGLTNAVDHIEMLWCEFDTMAAALHNEVGGGINAGASIGRILVRSCKFTNSASDAINMRLGTGGGATNMPVEFAEFTANEFENIDRRNIAMFYDNAPTNAAWPVDGFAIAEKNRLSGQQATENDAFGIRLDACADHDILSNHFSEMRRGTAPSGQEPIYTKGRRVRIEGNHLYNSGETQGCITAKGQDAGNPTDLSQCIIESNHVEVDVAGTFESAFWIQRSNCKIRGNFAKGPFSNYIIASQSASPYTDCVVSDNHFDMNGTAGNPGWEFFGNHGGWVSRNNDWISNQANAHTVIRMVSSTTGGVLIADPLIDGDRFINRGAGAVTAIAVENRAAGNITDPTVKGIHCVDIATAISIINTAPAGTVRLYGMTHAGAAPAINNGVGATLDQSGNSF